MVEDGLSAENKGNLMVEDGLSPDKVKTSQTVFCS
jgi:hypothetical protein